MSLFAGNTYAQSCELPTDNLTAPLTASEVTFGFNGTEIDTITILGQALIFDTVLPPDTVSYQWSVPNAADQVVVDNGTAIANITQGAAFDAALLAAMQDLDILHYIRQDPPSIQPTDYIQFEYNSPIISASNRYIFWVERGGNNTVELEAFDSSGTSYGLTPNIIANSAVYIDSGINYENGQNAEIAVFPLTAIAPAGSLISGIRYTQTGAPTGNRFDGGDGKIFAMASAQNLCPTSDLQTVKTLAAGSSATPTTGDTVEFEIEVTNAGADTATNVTLTDSLPAGLTATANNGTVTVGNYSGGTWTIPSLANGNTAVLTLEGTVDPGQGGSIITNTTTAATSPDQSDPSTAGDDLTEAVTVQNAPLHPPLPPLGPGSCGGVLAEAYLLDGLGIGAEQNYRLASGSVTHDPDVFFGVSGAEHGYTKNANGSVTYFFNGEAAAQSLSTQVSTSTTIRNIAAVSGSSADQTDAAEFWRITARIDGVPGQSYSFTMDNGNAHEFIHYWVEDSSGNVIDSSLGASNTANGWSYGTGANASTSSASGATSITAQISTLINYTIPTSSPDGIVFLHVMVLDPQVGWGRLTFDGEPECPAPSLAMDKVADNPGPYDVGDMITYTYTITNDGNVAIQDVAITDTHNGSDPAPIPCNETLLTDAAPAGDSTDATTNGSWDVLAPGDIVTFTGTYTVTQTDVDNL